MDTRTKPECPQETAYARSVAVVAVTPCQIAAYISLQRDTVKLEGLTEDLNAGFLDTFEERIHGELFGDFLEMASHLLSEGYKDAAAVIGGGTLEAHLRQLCSKHGVDVEVATSSGDLRPKKADRMNADLASANVYGKLDQKNVTAWLDLRNKAAHGEYDEYTRDQVALFIDAIRDFITRCPA